MAPLNAPAGELTLEATELFSGISAQLQLRVTPSIRPITLTADTAEPTKAEPVRAASSGTSHWAPADQGFGPHVRDIAVTAGGSLAVINAMNWDHNLYGIDLTTGAVRWRQRVGHYFAFAPRPIGEGVAIQRFDMRSAEGYHLYLAGADGQLERRFALYGLPKRLPHKFVPAILSDRINNFAVPADGSWVASAGDLGLAVWKRDGSPLWVQDWWKTKRHTAALAALDAETLLLIDGIQATAFAARSGERQWSLNLATTGEVRQVSVSADGKTVAVLTTTDGGTVVIFGDGKLGATLPTGGNEIVVSGDGSYVAVVAGDQLKVYSVTEGLRWVLPADDTLHSPRFNADGDRLAVASELGTLYVVNRDRELLLERDTRAIAVPAWLPDGDLVYATWTGDVIRLGPDFKERWSHRIEPTATDMRESLLADDRAPTTRIAGWGNAEATPAPVTPKLLDPQSVLIQFRAQSPHVQLQRPPAALVDGKIDAPAAPWLAWGDVGNFAETLPFNMLRFDGDAYGLAPRFYAGENKSEEVTVPKKIADSPPADWQVVRVDLWDILKKPTRIRGLRLSTIGGPAAFDQIPLGRTQDDLPGWK